MTDDEISGRLVALEILAMMSLGLYLANTRNDPDYSKARALLDHMKAAIRNQAQVLPPAAQMAAQQYGNQLLGTVLENLRVLRGEGGTTH
jgi:hypothetical protein